MEEEEKEEVVVEEEEAEGINKRRNELCVSVCVCVCSLARKEFWTLSFSQHDKKIARVRVENVTRNLWLRRNYVCFVATLKKKSVVQSNRLLLIQESFLLTAASSAANEWRLLSVPFFCAFGNESSP
jgi:hypothetical protein